MSRARGNPKHGGGEIKNFERKWKEDQRKSNLGKMVKKTTRGGTGKKSKGWLLCERSQIEKNGPLCRKAMVEK